MIFLSVKKNAFMSDILHIFVLINVEKRINGRKRSELFTVKISRYCQIVFNMEKIFFVLVFSVSQIEYSTAISEAQVT